MTIARLLIVFFLMFIFLNVPKLAFAETTPYRSAGWVGTDLWRTDPYLNLTGCQATDGIYCSHPSASGQMNLYFSSFGTLSDFGIAPGDTINKIHIRVTGRNTVTQWVQVDRGRNKPLQYLCQAPFDLWPVYLGPTDAVKQVDTVFDNTNFLFSCFSPTQIDNQDFTFALFFNGYNVNQWSADIDNFEIAFDYTPIVSTVIPTPTLTVMPTPTPLPTPAPFLDLPWDYQGKGQSFNDAALAITSYFDHSYPLLSSGLLEPLEFLNQVTIYKGENSLSKNYSRHDGYDYSNRANVHLGDSVLAAASGSATYINTCRACGNMIVIDHGNGYQTRYLHLQKDGLVTTVPNQPVWVEDRQVIGKVGATGNVNPLGDAGAHIHFGVFQDKNKDGNFEDNVPDGVTDPYGWQSEDTDPWVNYAFFYNGQHRTGNKSYYLWKNKIDGLRSDLPSNGGVFNVGHYKIEFPNDNSRPELKLNLQSNPQVNASNSLVSLGPGIDIVAKNAWGEVIKSFSGYITIKVEFNNVDLSHFDLGTTTFAIYSSDDQGHWLKEPTVIDLTNKTATTQVNHLTYFALMTTRIDTVAPVTIAKLQGIQGQGNWYRSDVKVSLSAQDNAGGLGVDYTLYKVDDEDWQPYVESVVFSTEGHHKVAYYSVDKDGNIEGIKMTEFDIDKTLPEAKIQYNLGLGDFEILGIDSSSAAIATVINLNKKQQKIIIADAAGNKLELFLKEHKPGSEAKLIIKSLQYNDELPINFDDNNFVVEYKRDKKTNKVKEFEQEWELDNIAKIELKYLLSTDKTKVITEIGEKRKELKSVDGMKTLQLRTEKGTLKISY